MGLESVWIFPLWWDWFHFLSTKILGTCLWNFYGLVSWCTLGLIHHGWGSIYCLYMSKTFVGALLIYCSMKVTVRVQYLSKFVWTLVGPLGNKNQGNDNMTELKLTILNYWRG